MRKYILIKFVLPKILKNIGLKETDITIEKDTAEWIITKFDKDTKGIRNLENVIKEILSKINFIVKNYKNIKDFKCLSFKTTKSLEYPVNITTSLIEEIITDEKGVVDKFKHPPFGMYL